MRRDEVLTILQAHREEAGPDSDVDVLVEFHDRAKFDLYMDLKFYLEDILGRPVDLVMRTAVTPRLAPYIERDMLHVA